MSDVDKSSKTEEPTEKKLGEAHAKGQFAKAPEISMTTTLLAGLLVILFLAPAKAEYLAEFTKSLLENLDSIILNQGGASFMLSEAYLTMAFIVLPLMVGCFVAAFVSEGMQTGFRYTPKVIEPKLSKFNPISGAKKIFGIKGLKTFLIDFLKFCAIGTVVWLTLLIFLDHPIFYAPIPIEEVLRFIYTLFLVLFTILVLMLLVIAVINFIIKKKENHEEMKMTKQEVKDENKAKDIAPEVKSALRQKAREILSSSGAQDVSTADVVVTNPTHYAVALRYQKGTDHAPVVVAKGENMLARRIKAIAIEYEVPLVENKPVARSLFALGRIGEAIPLELYRVVAEILANVYKAHSYYFHRLKARRLLARKKSPSLT
jgi:flagellar biosynthetic protein FlhB